MSTKLQVRSDTANQKYIFCTFFTVRHLRDHSRGKLRARLAYTQSMDLVKGKTRISDANRPAYVSMSTFRGPNREK